jgi:hypothetical protein
MKIEKGKYYLKIKDGYITDAVSYNPEIIGYKLFKITQLPNDILNQCYQIMNGSLILDQMKYQKYLTELEKEVI